MNQREKLQAIIDELRDSEAKMEEGDHISFGMICLFLFIFPMSALINGETWYFVGAIS